jgi:signal transduction histidine kinase
MKAKSAVHPNREPPFLIILYFFFYLSVLIRMVLNDPSNGVIEAPAYALMAGVLALSLAQLLLRRRWPVSMHVTLALQTLVAIALLLTKPAMDYYAVLFIALGIVAGRSLTSRGCIVWLTVFCVATTVALWEAFGSRAPNFFAVYIAGILLNGFYGRTSQRSEQLVAKLGEANLRLHAYAERSEEAAAAQERTYLARELHDAATQTVFSMSLTAETARIAVKNDPQKVPALIDRLEELAREALAEMRTLVRELRPSSVVEEGLVKSLEQLILLRKRRDDLKVTLTVGGDEQGSAEMKETIFRTVREALNNIAKHAGVKESHVDLSFASQEITLMVKDSGRGFDPARERHPETFGLLAMRERLEALGGSLVVRSAPGAGTEIRAQVPLRGR